MKVVLQRVKRAAVTVFDEGQETGRRTGEISRGLVLLAAFRIGDTSDHVSRLAKKIAELRIFEDSAGKMNRALAEVGGQLLVVSQFTLYGDTRRGRRPSFTESMPPAEAEKLYELFIRLLRNAGVTVATGEFGAKMEVEIINDGPVTFILDDESAAS
jgi:D-aminoacyl-tRNA deacylase